VPAVPGKALKVDLSLRLWRIPVKVKGTVDILDVLKVVPAPRQVRRRAHRALER
jgi:hypothetical protein